MRLGERQVDVPRAVFAVLAVAVVGGLVFGAATSAAAFGWYNPGWEGTADLRGLDDDEGAEPTLARNASAYGGAGDGTVAYVVAPTEPYSDRDAARVAGFVERGGTLVVADRDGTGNELLATVGAEARVDGVPVRDERHYYRSPALPEATEVSDHPLTDGVDAVTLNHGTVVEPGNATVLVRTSPFAYRDENRNDRLDDDETMAAHAVVTLEEVGDGRVVVVSDPSAFINVMLERPGNRALAANLVSDHDRAVVDVSHADDVPPLVAALETLRESLGLQLALVLGALGVLGAWRRPWPETAWQRLSDGTTTEGVMGGRRKGPGDE